MSNESVKPPARGPNPPPKSKPLKWILILVVLLAVIVAIRPIYHVLKTKRANQFAVEGNQLVQAGEWNEGAKRYRAALQMDPANYQALRGAARLATKANRPEAAGIWEQLNRLPECTVQDRQEYAGILIQEGRFSPAGNIIEPLLKKNPDSKTLLLAARYSNKIGETPKAIQFARLAVKQAPNEDGTRVQLAELLAKSTSPAEQDEARKILWELANKPGEFKDPAIEALAQAPQLSVDEKKRVLALLDEGGGKDIHRDLLTADIRLQIQPDNAAAIYDQMVGRWKSDSIDQLIHLGRWLNFHQQSERVLSLFSLSQAFENNQLLLTRLDALASLQRWNDIDELLNRREVTLDPCVVESFRARTASERGATLDSETHWNHAVSLAGSDPDKLRFVANFAEQSHAGDAALKAYEALARFPEAAREAYLGTERVGRRTGDATTERAAAEKMAAASPDDPAAADRLAYLNLLLNSNVDESLATAKRLAQKYTDRLSYRVTAALGDLRKHDAAGALAEFNAPVPIDWKRTQPAWRAVYAAALIASGRKDEARDLIATIPVDRLNAEERALIEQK